jgi:hypothetical protein
MADFTNIGPERGPILHRHGLDAIGVLESRDNNSPIGMALGWYWDAEGRSTFQLTVHGAQVPGLWIVVDREFIPAPDEGRGPVHGQPRP